MIPAMLDGKDIVAESPTGSGKTLAYVLPILNKVDGAKTDASFDCGPISRTGNANCRSNP